MVEKEGKEMEKTRKRSNHIASIACLTLLSVLTITGQGVKKAYAGDIAVDPGKKVFEERRGLPLGQVETARAWSVSSAVREGPYPSEATRLTTGVFRFARPRRVHAD
jgi:hypothetical protein